jgi:hypothetical protein
VEYAIAAAKLGGQMTDNHTELASGMRNEETGINIHSVQLPNEDILR